MSDNEKMFYDLFIQMLEKLNEIQDHLRSIENDTGTIIRRM